MSSPTLSFEKKPVAQASKNRGQLVEKKRKKTIRTFRYFKKLPVELRFRIYRYSSLYQRIIRADWSTKTARTSHSSVYTLSAGLVPTVLRINRETRNEALKYYVQSKKYITYAGPAWHKEEKIWIGMQDVIYFINFPPRYNFSTALRMINKQCALTHLACGLQDYRLFFFDNPRQHPCFLQACVRSFPTIKKFTVVFDSSGFKETKEIAKYQFSPLGNLRLNAVRSRQDVEYEYNRQVWDSKAVERWYIEDDKKVWRAFLEKHPDWAVPRMECVKISKRR